MVDHATITRAEISRNGEVAAPIGASCQVCCCILLLANGASDSLASPIGMAIPYIALNDGVLRQASTTLRRRSATKGCAESGGRQRYDDLP